ncbi:hypothetical protein BJ684DRAFT_19627 [Piptocephalis cylindrospora]|uniref:Coiled-coil domain-containing protein 137 n=1 Tax=Piptocephalis cylindrospora TaxID=1907219 RepID=A0A4P9Y7M1_9FUNG|nr:hypothetical protein BJ684DRAFT_19627 [Piptocephalis cylindrospora]|eukprot:RKP13920.1 hypothetical protein BJ684DRAFT_19627 [Piptocephalis cylindrospora]
MGRRKGSLAQTPKESDPDLGNAPGKDDFSGLQRAKRGKRKTSPDDMPRGFALLMKHQEFKKRKVEEKKQEAEARKTQMKKKKEKGGTEQEDLMKDMQAKMKQAPGESFDAYSRRLREVTHQAVRLAQDAPSATPKEISDRVRKNRETRKTKLGAKFKDQEEESSSKFYPVDVVRFGDVADAPPMLSVKPKARGNAAILEAALKAKRERELSGKAAEERQERLRKAKEKQKTETTALDQELDDMKRRNRERARGLSGAAKAAREKERDRIISGYRSIRAKKQADMEANKPNES